MTIIRPDEIRPACDACGDEDVLSGFKGMTLDLPSSAKLALTFSLISSVENTVRDAVVCPSCLSGLLFSVASEIQGQASRWKTGPLIVPAS